MFSFFPKKKLLLPEQEQLVTQAIADAEKQTSGEVRVFMESRNPLVSTLDRAANLFVEMGMQKTEKRNGVLIYLATKDREVAIVGDEGIHNLVGTTYWNQRIQEMVACFKDNQITPGLVNCINMVGAVLAEKFPYDSGTDKNELPDEIHYGK
jgi:uncharacterized membrane protein